MVIEVRGSFEYVAEESISYGKERLKVNVKYKHPDKLFRRKLTYLIASVNDIGDVFDDYSDYIKEVEYVTDNPDVLEEGLIDLVKEDFDSVLKKKSRKEIKKEMAKKVSKIDDFKFNVKIK